MLLVSVSLSAQERYVNSDTVSRSVPDTLRRTYSHTDAVQLMNIYRDTIAARDIWKRISSEDSGYAPANYYLSKSYEDIDDVTIEYARRAYEADSTNKWYAQNYGTQLISLSRYNEALPIYRRMVKLDNNDITSYYGLAFLYGFNDMPYSAISVLDSADMRLGRNPHTSALKQQLLISTKQYDRAVEECCRIVEEYPYNIETYSSLAHSYELSGRDSLALVTLEKAFGIDSTDVNIIDHLSSYHARHGNVSRMFDYDAMLMGSDEMTDGEKVHRVSMYTYDLDFYAKNYYRIGNLIQILVIKHPNSRVVVDTYASHLIAGGNTDQALDYLRRHLSDAAAEDYIYVMQLDLLMERDDLLFKDLATALSLYPTDFDILSFAGFVYSEKGRHREALSIFKRCLNSVENDDQRSMLLGYIGDVYHEQGKDNRAFKYYDMALQYNGDNALVLNNYAYFLALKDRELDKALSMSARAIHLEADNSSYLDTHAWVLHRLGRNDEAKNFMRQALSLSSQREVSLLMHYGDILWALGEKFLAETYWDKAVDNGFDAEDMKRHKSELMKK